MITEQYRELNRQLHEDHSVKYGYKGYQQAERVFETKLAFACRSVLDYGAGKRTLAQALRRFYSVRTRNYDPAVRGIDHLPRPADLVVCCDVMEHVEPPYVGHVILHLHSLTKKILFLRVCTVPCTSKTLPDGTDPHRTVWTELQWESAFSTVFDIEKYLGDAPNYFTVLLKPRRKSKTSRGTVSSSRCP
jgi:hypothetical protein